MLIPLATAFGVLPVDTSAFTVTTGAAAFAKSAYVQLTAGFAQAMTGLQIAWRNANAPTGAEYVVFMDIAFGAPGSELVMIRDFPMANNAFQEHYATPVLPLFVPPNTRVSIRMSSSGAGAQVISVYDTWQASSPATPNTGSLSLCLGLADPVTSLVGGTSTVMSTTQGAFGTPQLYSAAVPFTARAYRAHPISLTGATFRTNFLKLSTDAAGNGVCGLPLLFNGQNGLLSEYSIRGPSVLPCLIPAGQPLYLSVASDVAGSTVGITWALHLFP